MKTMRSIAWLLVLLLANDVSAQVALPAGSGSHAVLLVTLVEPEVMNSHMGYTIFSSYEKPLSNDWALDKVFARTARTRLEEAGHRVVEIDVSQEKLVELRKRFNAKTDWTKPWIEQEHATWLRKELTDAGADTAVLISSYSRTIPPTSLTHSGYGLLSMHGKKTGFAFLYANVAARVVSGEPFRFAKRPRPGEADCMLYFHPSELKGDSFEDIKAADLIDYRPAIQEIGNRRIVQDLIVAGLIPGKSERCKKGPLREGGRL